MKYEGNSNFVLCSSILFKNEIINFRIDSPKEFRIQLISKEDNTCLRPEKYLRKDGFSLKIKSGKENDQNEYLSCLIKVIICERFYFMIDIQSIIKTFDYDFLVSYKGIDGYLYQKIYCPIKKQGKFLLKLRFEVNHERICKFQLKNNIENNKFIKIINEGPKVGQFSRSKDIYIEIQLLEAKKTDIKFIANVNGKEKYIMVYFEEQNVCKNKNFGFKNIDNIEKNKIIVNSGSFRYYLNELNAYGNKDENKDEIVKNKKMK